MAGVSGAAWEVQHLLLVYVAEFRLCHVRIPARVHRDTGPVRDRAVPGHPSVDVVRRNLRIRICRRFRPDVDDRERHDETSNGKLGDALAVRREMQIRPKLSPYIQKRGSLSLFFRMLGDYGLGPCWTKQ